MRILQQFGPVQIELPQVERAVRQLWTDAGCEVSFTTSNFLVVTEKRHLDRVRAALDDLGPSSPSRQVILVTDAPARPVEASLVWEGAGYVERIETPVAVEFLGQVSSEVLRPAGLNHSWWACEDPPGQTALGELARASDQLILDTSALRTLDAGRCQLSDLAWARTARWRELIAQLFDDPIAVTQRHDLEYASVRYIGTDDWPAQLFAAWLADRLGWPDLQHIRLSSEEAARDRGDLTAVMLGGPHTEFSVEARDSMVHAEVVYAGQARSFEVPLQPMTLAQGLSGLMVSPVHDEAFIRARVLRMRSIPAGTGQEEQPRHAPGTGAVILRPSPA